MIQALLLMAGLGAFCGLVLSIVSRVFYVYEDPRIEQVQDWLAGANCGGCGYAQDVLLLQWLLWQERPRQMYVLLAEKNLHTK
jgi:hypothetical protein